MEFPGRGDKKSNFRSCGGEREQRGKEGIILRKRKRKRKRGEMMNERKKTPCDSSCIVTVQCFLHMTHGCTTDPFTISGPQNMSIDKFYAVRTRRSMDCEAEKL